VGALGRPRLVTADPEGRPNFPLLRSVHLPSRLVEAQLYQIPSIGEEAKLPPLFTGMVTVGPGKRPNSLLYTGVCTTLVVGFL